MEFSPVPKEVRSGYLIKLKSLFDIMDMNQNGELEVNELKAFLNKLSAEQDSISEDESQKIMKYFDINKSGSIDFNEFVLMAEQLIPLREIYQAVIAGEVMDVGDEMTEEMKAGTNYRR